MDKPNHAISTPGYETRDANAGGVVKFLIALAIVLVGSAFVCWGMFHIFTMRVVDEAATPSPFADTRQLPSGPQLQVNPREDYLKFRQQQEQALQTYGWQNQSAGTARVPIDVAMDLLVKKGVPVQGAAPAQASADAKKPMSGADSKSEEKKLEGKK